MSDRETAQKSLINYALQQLRQAIEDAKSERPSKTADNLGKICAALSEAEQQKTKDEITEEELEQKIIQIAKKIK